MPQYESRRANTIDVSCGNSAWSSPMAVLAPLDVMRLFSGSRPWYFVRVAMLRADSVTPSALARRRLATLAGASYEIPISRSFRSSPAR